jgi:hypothetical protein
MYVPVCHHIGASPLRREPEAIGGSCIKRTVGHERVGVPQAEAVEDHCFDRRHRPFVYYCRFHAHLDEDDQSRPPGAARRHPRCPRQFWHADERHYYRPATAPGVRVISGEGASRVPTCSDPVTGPRPAASRDLCRWPGASGMVPVATRSARAATHAAPSDNPTEWNARYSNSSVKARWLRTSSP